MNKINFSSPCHFGLESVLSGELKRMGADNVAATNGRVNFSGDYATLAKANLWLRTAERVQIVLGSFKASTFEELFEGVAALPLENFIGRFDAFPVKGWSLDSQLTSIPACQSIIKKAAVKRLGRIYGINYFEETGAVHQLQFSLHKNECTLYLDTSGPGLHKRGYRPDANEAPIKETLAAGILDIARIFPDTQIYDPCCGSGTFLIEAALKAYNIAPGIKRRFSAEKWDQIPESVWQNARKEATESIRKGITFNAFGSDIDPISISLTEKNSKKAGVSAKIQTEVADISQFIAPEGKSLVVANPPYGERMMELKAAEEMYKTMGQVFEQKPGVSYFIISSHEEFEKFFGRKADKRRKLYNGMLKCQLFMYFG